MFCELFIFLYNYLILLQGILRYFAYAKMQYFLRGSAPKIGQTRIAVLNYLYFYIVIILKFITLY